MSHIATKERRGELMKTRHDRRHSGRKYTKVYHPEIFPYEEEKYDDWENYRDSMRAPIDRSRIRPTKGIRGWFLDKFEIIADNWKLNRKERIMRIQMQKMEIKNMPKQKPSFICIDCGSRNRPYHNEFCTMGDIGWIAEECCPVCGKPMVNTIDSITGEVSPYLWKTTCEHLKDKIISKG